MKLQKSPTLADSICDLRTRKIKATFFNQINTLIDWKNITRIIDADYLKGKSAVGKPSYDGLLLFKICFFVKNNLKNNLMLYSAYNKNPLLNHKRIRMVLYDLSKTLLFGSLRPTSTMPNPIFCKLVQTLCTRWSVIRSFVTETIMRFKNVIFRITKILKIIY